VARNVTDHVWEPIACSLAVDKTGLFAELKASQLPGMPNRLMPCERG
jgi:hypothetical protein